MMYAPFQNQKHLKEIGDLLSEAEAEQKKRGKPKPKPLDWMLMALVIALVVIAFTRLAVWLAKAF